MLFKTRCIMYLCFFKISSFFEMKIKMQIKSRKMSRAWSYNKNLQLIWTDLNMAMGWLHCHMYGSWGHRSEGHLSSLSFRMRPLIALENPTVSSTSSHSLYLLVCCGKCAVSTRHRVHWWNVGKTLNGNYDCAALKVRGQTAALLCHSGAEEEACSGSYSWRDWSLPLW